VDPQREMFASRPNRDMLTTVETALTGL